MTVWQLIPATTRTTGKDGQVCSQTTCSGDPNGPPVPNVTPGPVESGVQDEIGGLAAEARPGLAQAALCMARLLDNPKAVNQQPAAAKVLAAMLEKLRSTSARGRHGGLSLVRTITEKGGA